MKGNAYPSIATNVPGWETIAEQDLLVQLAKAVPKKGLIVEIGGEFGQSASLFAYGAKPSVVIVSIDPRFAEGNEIGQIFMENLSEAGFENRIRMIPKSSHDAVGDIDKEINLLFIDGDHNYLPVKQDIEDYLGKMAFTSVVAFHDYAGQTNSDPHPLHYDVKRAVDEWFGLASADGWKKIHEVDSLVVFARTEVAQKPLKEETEDATPESVDVTDADGSEAGPDERDQSGSTDAEQVPAEAPRSTGRQSRRSGSDS